MKTSLTDFSPNFLIGLNDILSKLPPVIYHLGGTIGTMISFLCPISSYKKRMIFNLGLLTLSYAMTLFPNFFIVMLSRFLIGFTTSFMCIIISQLLHSTGNEETRSTLMSIYPFFNLLGLTAGVALEYFDHKNTYWMVLLAPISLCLMMITYFFCVKNILPVVSEEKMNFRSMWHLITKSVAIKSIISIIAMQIITRTTGIDLLMLFSSAVFSGKNTYFQALIPLFISVACAPFGGILPKYIGRKKLMFTALIFIASLCFTLFLIGPHVVTASLFIMIYHGVIGTIPELYKNEVIPSEYKPMANKVGTLVSWFLGFLVTLFITFVYTKQSNTIWLIFFILTLIGAILVFFFMMETGGVIECDWIENWVNIGFSRKQKLADLEIN